MNLFNRFITILAIVLVWFVIVAVAAAPGTAQGWAQQGLDWAGNSLDAFQAQQPGWLWLLIRAGVIVSVTLLALALLWNEVRRKKTPVVKVRLPSGGEGSVTADSVARRLAWHLDQLADVVTAAPHIKTRGAAVDVTIDLETAPDVDVPMKTEEVIAVTRDVVETQMGLRVNKTEVRIHHAPYQEAL